MLTTSTNQQALLSTEHPKYILYLAKLKGKGRLCWSGKAETYPLACGGNVSYYKSAHHGISTRGNREHPGNF